MKPYFHILDTVDSTNDFLRQVTADAEEDRVILAVARQQTRGRGQRGTHWQSQAGENLLFSGLFPLPGLAAARQFDIARSVSVFLAKFLEDRGLDEVQIKWPNDILARGRKIAGILIEHSLRGGLLHRTLVGIGLNVNQSDFGALNTATSMKLESGTSIVLSELTGSFVEEFTAYMTHPLRWGASCQREYEERLYGLGNRVSLRCAISGDGMEWSTGIICGVTPEGRLIQRQDDGAMRYFVTKEVSWVY